MSSSIYDEVEIEDFDFDAETSTYFFPCPCGDKFRITRVRVFRATPAASSRLPTRPAAPCAPVLCRRSSSRARTSQDAPAAPSSSV